VLQGFLVGGDLRKTPVGLPGLHELLCKLAAGLHQEGTRAHGRVAHGEVQDLLGGGPLAQGLQHGAQGGPHDGQGQFPRRVVGAGATALLAWLEIQGPPGDQVRRIARHLLPEGCHHIVRGGGLLQALRRGGDARLVLQPLGPVRRLLGQQRLDVDHRVRRNSALLLGVPLHAQRQALGPLDREAHHGFVDRANLLDVQGPVGQALSLQHQQRVQHPVETAVGDPGDLHTPVAGASAALQEGVLVWIEELPVAGRQPQTRVPAAVVHQPEQGQEPGPGAVALVHRVRVKPVVLAQAVVEPAHRVVVDVDRVRGHQVLVLGVQEEDEPEERGQHPSVDLLQIRVRVPQQAASGSLVGGLEPAQQVPQGTQHLAGQFGRNLALVAAAVDHQVQEAAARRGAEHPVLGQQHVERRQDGPTGHLEHGRYGEGQVPRAFAARGVDQTQVGPVQQEPCRDLPLPQQPLQAGLGAGVPPHLRAYGQIIEIRSWLQHVHQGQGLPLTHRVHGHEVRAQGVPVVRQGHLQPLRQVGPSGRPGQVLGGPSQEARGEGGEVGQAEFRVAVGRKGPLVAEGGELVLQGHRVALRDGLPLHQGRRGHHQPDGLQKSQPVAVDLELGIGGHQRDTGQR